MTSKFQKVQEAYEKRLATDPTQTIRGSSWDTNWQHYVWNEWYDLWKHRNSLIHEGPKDKTRNPTRENIVKHVEHLYEQAKEVGGHQHHIFANDSSSHIRTSNNNQLQNWIHTWEETVKQCVKNQRKPDPTQNKITDHFKSIK